jgi:hypothetical protein
MVGELYHKTKIPTCVGIFARADYWRFLLFFAAFFFFAMVLK